MVTNQTQNKLHSLRMLGMIKALEEQSKSTQYHSMTFEERFGLIVDREFNHRNNRQIERRIKNGTLKFPSACPEDVDWKAQRGLDKNQFLALQSCSWIVEKQNIILIGPTGTGKTWLSCALSQKACVEGFTVKFYRTPRLFADLNAAKSDGTFMKLLKKIARYDVVVFDDWGQPLNDSERRDFMEIIEDRNESRSTIFTTQLSTEKWHEVIGDPTTADSIMDRIIHRAHVLNLSGDTQRKKYGGIGSRNKK